MATHHAGRRVLVLALAGLAGAALSGCATKGYVKGELRNIEERVGRAESSAGQASAEARDAQGLARAGGDRAQQAMLQAELAKEMALGHVRREEVRSEVVYFAFDSAALNADARTMLDGVIEEVRANPNYMVLLLGWTDSTGDEQYNQALAQRRAAAANHYLARSLGREFVRVASIGLGELPPPGEVETAEMRRQNRRVDLSIVKPAPASETPEQAPQAGMPNS